MYRRVKLVDRLQPRALMVVLLLTGLAWVLPAFALSGVLRLLQSPLPFIPVLGMFSYSTIIGSITGLPLGMGVTGSLLVRELQSQGVGLAGAVLSTAVFRMGTAWFSVALGLLAALLYRRRMSAILHAQETYDHFDEIAKSYEEQIPSHIRDRLLVRKVHVMHQRLEAKEVSHRGRGLDIGCGHGWYTCEMVRLGYDMYAIDQAEQQIHLARRYAHKQNVQVQFEVASALKLPFTDNCFDFAYAINMMHHMATIKSQRQAFVEIVRVLKPGGVFFLHEINSSNLLFRFYVGYVFPMIRAIDEGNERWIRPSRLPNVAGAWWEAEIDYFTFLPDFIPAVLLQPLARFEHVLERSRFKSWSAHYVARLVKES
jgi:2-polyprenyl-3-methyl-5-hydroxy-6-metoxy-1,4-benzoquinol methylase